MADLVAIDCPPGPRFVTELQRAWEDGDAVVPLQQEAPRAARRNLAVRLGARRLVTGSGVEELPRPRPVEDDTALVVLTSGTTGEPRAVVLDHAAVEYSAFAGATALSVDADTHWLACLPLSHVGGLSVVTRAIHTGADLSVVPRFGAEVLRKALDAGATHVSLVPTALGRIDPAPWRRILVGGSAVPEHLPGNCTATYGMTETMGGVVYDGLALNGVEVRIEDVPHGEVGAVGRVQLRTPTLMRGYRALADHEGVIAEAPEAPVDSHGWYTTGDLGRLAAAGAHLEVLGRADELIITGAEKVWPAPVERRLEAHPAVAEAAVVGVADPEWGQAVTALVVPAAGQAPADLETLREWVSEELPRACAPKRIELVQRLPRTALGKLARSRLDELVQPTGGSAQGS